MPAAVVACWAPPGSSLLPVTAAAGSGGSRTAKRSSSTTVSQRGGAATVAAWSGCALRVVPAGTITEAPGSLRNGYRNDLRALRVPFPARVVATRAAVPAVPAAGCGGRGSRHPDRHPVRVSILMVERSLAGPVQALGVCFVKLRKWLRRHPCRCDGSSPPTACGGRTAASTMIGQP